MCLVFVINIVKTKQMPLPVPPKWEQLLFQWLPEIRLQMGAGGWGPI
jgi:hypothetical protein